MVSKHQLSVLHDQKAAVQQASHPERRSFFCLSALMVQTQVALTSLYFAHIYAKHRPRLLPSRSEATPHENHIFQTPWYQRKCFVVREVSSFSGFEIEGFHRITVFSWNNDPLFQRNTIQLLSVQGQIPWAPAGCHKCSQFSGGVHTLQPSPSQSSGTLHPKLYLWWV